MSTRGRTAGAVFRLCLGAAGAMVVAGGCANIIGVSDLEADDDESIIARGGSAGAGAGGSTSTSKGGGTGKGGSGDGGAPMTTGPTDCNGDPLELNEDLVRGCIMYESCFVPSRTISTCVTYNMPAVFTGLSCAQGAMDCNDIVSCRHVAFVHPDAPVSCDDAATPDSGACVDNFAVNCTNANTPLYTDCDAEGGTCVLEPDNWASCQVVASCTEAEGESGCSGDLWYQCRGGVGYGTDCAASAATCEEYLDPDGLTAYDCFYATTACGADSAACSGDNAVLCSDGSRLQFDCGASNLGCDDSTTDLYCLAPGCSVNDADTCLESCNGSMLTFCIGGSPVTVDCQDYGFDTCREDTLDGFDVAVCGYNF